jgi:GT2 family glycosyltransferase
MLKFHDDDNVPKEGELLSFAKAMATRRAHAISCAMDVFESEDFPTADTPVMRRVLFLGDGGAAAYLDNVMGDANFIIDRKVFGAVGGFDERGYLARAEDWSFLAKVKGSGYIVSSLPDGLVWYRVHPGDQKSSWGTIGMADARSRVRRALAGHMSDEVQQLIALAQAK